MKTSMFEKGIPMLARARTLVGALFAVLSFAGAGCEGGFTDTGVSEGNRCNPLDSHNECGSGLVCTGQGSSPAVPFCPENYCCPVDRAAICDDSRYERVLLAGMRRRRGLDLQGERRPGGVLVRRGRVPPAAMALDEDAAGRRSATDMRRPPTRAVTDGSKGERGRRGAGTLRVRQDCRQGAVRRVRRRPVRSDAVRNEGRGRPCAFGLFLRELCGSARGPLLGCASPSPCMWSPREELPTRGPANSPSASSRCPPYTACR